MAQRKKEPPVPPERAETLRQEIVTVLSAGHEMTARQLSAELSVPERRVYGELEHVQKSLRKSGMKLEVRQSTCKKCGFEFARRQRLSRPGRCPVCKGESITEPVFSISRS